MFNPELLSKIISKAKGDRTLTEFAKECKISTGNLSKIVNKVSGQAPYPATLKKIADHAYNNVTFFDLMDASGYTTDNLINPKDKIDVEEKLKKLKADIINHPDQVVFSGQPLNKDTIENLVHILDFTIDQTTFCASKK
ncbi:MAG: hypothetical protein PUE01_03110 [Clostridiaceae bacterium]|nr:hypothetical protein [Clostridiaceae bacterium]